MSFLPSQWRSAAEETQSNSQGMTGTKTVEFDMPFGSFGSLEEESAFPFGSVGVAASEETPAEQNKAPSTSDALPISESPALAVLPVASDQAENNEKEEDIDGDPMETQTDAPQISRKFDPSQYAAKAPQSSDVAMVPEEKVAQIATAAEVPASSNTSAATPSEAALVEQIRFGLLGKDLTQLKLGEFRKDLERRLSLEPGALDNQKEKLQGLITAEIRRIQLVQKEEAKLAKQEQRAAVVADSTAVETATKPAVETPTKVQDRAARHSLAGTARRPLAERQAQAGSASPLKQSGRTSLGGRHGESGRKRKHGGRRGGEEDKDGGRKAGEEEDVPETVTNMTREEFLEEAKDVPVLIGGKKLRLSPKVFASSGCGFYALEKVLIPIGGRLVEVQCQINCAVLGSREWTDKHADPSAAATTSAADGLGPAPQPPHDQPLASAAAEASTVSTDGAGPALLQPQDQPFASVAPEASTESADGLGPALEQPSGAASAVTVDA